MREQSKTEIGGASQLVQGLALGLEGFARAPVAQARELAPRGVAHPLRPVVRRMEDGRFDVAALERSCDAAFLEGWLRSRLAGGYPYLPPSPDSLDAPEDLFVEIWRWAEPRGCLREGLAMACERLLQEAWKLEAQPPPWTGPLLRLVGAVHPLRCQPFLTRIALAAPGFSAQLVEQSLDLAWLQAAAAYPRQNPELFTHWPVLLREQPRYQVLAYQALARDPELAILHLATYFEALPSDERAFLLREALRDILQALGPSLTRRRLEAYGREFFTVEGLCDAINQQLKALGCPAVFQQPRPSSPPAEPDTSSKLRGLALVS